MFRRVVPLTLTLLLAASALAQVPPDQAAAMLLTSARRAYNEKNYPFAAQRFKEFLDKFGGHKDANAARFGLALCLLEGPERDYQKIGDALAPLANAKDLPEHPLALYYLGQTQRALGLRELALADGKPQELPQRRAAAKGRFDEAARHFAASAAAFAPRLKDVPADVKELPADAEWAARARCDQAEMELRTQKIKETRATAEALLNDPLLGRAKVRDQARYLIGHAAFLQKDTLAAGRALNVPGVLNDPVSGPHARYLLARLHHMADERAEAAAQYEAVLAAHDKVKKDAQEALKQPDRFKNNPEEKARLEALVNRPAPEHVARAGLYLGTLLYEAGRFADAQTRLQAFAQQYANTPLANDALLRAGFCQVQQRQWAEAQRTLAPLADREPRLADQALLWAAKAQLGAADPGKPAEYAQAVKTALDTLRRAADRAAQAAANDPDARVRRAEIQLETADALQLAGQPKEAANLYAAILAEKLLPDRAEELLERRAAALHLAGDFAESDRLCAEFEKTYPQSTLLPAVLFRQAENAAFAWLAADKNPNTPDRAATLTKLNDEVSKRYAALLARFADFPQASLARYGLALAHYRKGDLDKSLEVLKTIPDTDRTGELALVPYLQADILLRQAATRADDALAAGQLDDQLKEAAALLESYASAQPNTPQTPDALLKLGHCLQRRAALMAQPEEKAKLRDAARAAYDKLRQQFPKSELVAHAVLERAKVQAQANDLGGATNELRRFTTEYKSSPVAPMALIQLATLLRGQNRAAEAADLLDRARKEHEAALVKDPARASWVALLQYHHGLALAQAAKRPEARAVLELVIKNAPGRPEAADAALRYGQTLKDDGLAKLDTTRKALAAAGSNPDTVAKARPALDDSLKTLSDAAAYLEKQAAALKDKQPVPEAAARTWYEAAWAYRALADAETAAAREKLRQERWQKLREQAQQKAGPGKPVPALPLPEVALIEVPPPPAEARARAAYQALVAALPDAPLALDARAELADLLAERGEHEAAVKLAREALDKEPPADLTERLKLRLGAGLAALGQPAEALPHFQTVIANPKSPLLPQAYLRLGEAHLAQNQPAEAVKALTPFRDKGEFQNLPGTSDRAFLRLGLAFGLLKQWDPSRQAHEQVVNRFGAGSPWIHEARYGIGWALQSQKQLDPAVGAYQQVVNGTAAEIAARAQLQIGLCRLEQKRLPEAVNALLTVATTYDYPEVNAAALCEAARALAEQKQTDAAARLLERVLKEHAQSPWAAIARQRLQSLKDAPKGA